MRFKITLKVYTFAQLFEEEDVLYDIHISFILCTEDIGL